MRSHGWKVWGAALAAVALVACGGNNDGGGSARPCDDASQCATDEICLSGLCTSRTSGMCADDFECSVGEYCAEGTCTDAACTEDSECLGDAICNDGICGAGCRDASDCDTSAGEVCNEDNVCELPGCLQPGNECTDVAETCDTSLDVPRCVSTGMCRYDAASPIAGAGDCARFASEQNDGEDYICNPDGRCVLNPPCVADVDCAAGQICEPRASDGRSVCRIGCRPDNPDDPDNQRRRCTANQICDTTGAFAPDDAVGPTTNVCVDGCSSDADCNILLSDPNSTYYCDQATITCKLVCDGDELICRNSMGRFEGTVCRPQAGGPQACDSCTGDEQCLPTQLCDKSLGFNPADQIDPDRGLCVDRPPACPMDDFGNNTSLTEAFEVTELPFEVDGRTEAEDDTPEQVAGPRFCRDNDDFGEWFEVELTEGTIFTARLEYPSGGNLDLALKNAAGADLVASAQIPDDDEGVEELRYGISAAGTYYVQVRGVIQNPNTPYALFMDAAVPGVCDDSLDALEGDGNNTADEAVALPIMMLNENLRVCADNLDYYTIEAGANQVVEVEATAEERLGGIELTIFDPAGNPIGESTALPDGERVEFTTSAPGTYIVEIRLQRELGFNDYTLRWNQRLNECADPFEDPPANDTALTAAVLPLMPVPDTNDLVFSAPGLRVCTDTDWYQVNLLPQQTITVSATYSRMPLTGILDLRLRGPNNPDIIAIASTTEPVMVADPTRTESLTFNTGALGGIYYIAVTLNQGSNVEYDLNVDVDGGEGCTDDALEPNSSAANATLIDRALLAAGDATENAKVGLQICDTDEDFYQIDLQAGDDARFIIKHNAGSGLDIDAELIAPDGTTTQYTTTTDDEEIVITNAQAGTYTLRVFGKVALRNAYNLLTYLTPMGGTEIGPVDPNCPDQFEDNDSRAMATLIAPGTYPLLACARPTLDDDWFRISVGPGETLQISVTSVFSRGDINLLLYDDSGAPAPIATSRTPSNLEQIVYTSARQQELFFNVTPASSITTNAYTLDVSVTASPACTDDALEPNDTGATAATIASPGFASRLIKCETNEDWFQFDATMGQRTGVYLSHPVSGDLDLEVYDNAAGTGTPVATSVEVPRRGEEVEFVPAATQTYYVKVTSAVPTRLGYDLIINRDLDLSGTFDTGEGVLDKTCPDQFEDNDIPNQSVLITPGNYTDLRLCFFPGVFTDLDYYNVEVPDGQTLTVDLTFVHDAGNLDLTLRNVTGPFTFVQSQTSNSMQNFEQVTYTNSTGMSQTMQIQVRGGPPAGYDVDYDLSITVM